MWMKKRLVAVPQPVVTVTLLSRFVRALLPWVLTWNLRVLVEAVSQPLITQAMQ